MNTRRDPLPRRRLILRIVNGTLALIIVMLIIWGIRTFYVLDNGSYTDDARVDVYITPINTRVAGYVRSVRFWDHQRLRKGDTLLLLDDSEYRVQVKQAAAAYMAALAGKEAAISAINTISSGFPVSDAQTKALGARLWNARQNFHRFENLLRDSAATMLQFEQAKTAYDVLAAEGLAQNGQRKTIALTATEARKKVSIHDAEILQAAALLEQAKLNLSYTVIRAPYDGTTGIRTIQEGQLLQAGQVVLSFVRNDRKWVIANFRETQVTQLHIGQQMKIAIDGFPGTVFRGHITGISPATGNRFSSLPMENANGNFIKVRQRIPVRIELQAAAADSPAYGRLIGGMNAEVTTAEK
jgi:membrane fusion protein, multidrug efflux system